MKPKIMISLGYIDFKIGFYTEHGGFIDKTYKNYYNIHAILEYDEFGDFIFKDDNLVIHNPYYNNLNDISNLFESKEHKKSYYSNKIYPHVITILVDVNLGYDNIDKYSNHESIKKTIKEKLNNILYEFSTKRPDLQTPIVCLNLSCTNLKNRYIQNYIDFNDFNFVNTLIDINDTNENCQEYLDENVYNNEYLMNFLYENYYYYILNKKLAPDDSPVNHAINNKAFVSLISTLDIYKYFSDQYERILIKDINNILNKHLDISK